MKTLVETYIDESIELELNVSKLYYKFYELFPEDSGFWWTLVIEEKNHASLLETIKSALPFIGDFPENITPEKNMEVRQANERIVQLINTFKRGDSRRKAFETALSIETSAGESHYQAFVDNQEVSEAYRVFQKLNMEDSKHADRMKEYMKDKQI